MCYNRRQTGRNNGIAVAREGMMGVLLTPEQRKQIRKDAADAFFLKDDGAYDGLSFPESVNLAQRELLASIDEALCRAQVRKVVDVAEPLIQEALNAVTPSRTLCEAAAKALVALRAALKTAGGE